MNQLLGSPLEPLAFNYVSFGIFTVVNNLWTWVAVVAAAISFLSIRAVSSANLLCSVSKTDQEPSDNVVDRTEDETPRSVSEAEEKLPSRSVAETSATVSPSVCDTDGVMTKGGKFRLTVCYEDDDVDGETTVAEWSCRSGGDYDKEGSCGEWWESWERVLRMRNGERGWYRYQELAALNGNVVRLWKESCKGGRYRSSNAVW